MSGGQTISWTRASKLSSSNISTMSAVPEIKQKKIDRDIRLAKEAEAAAVKAAADAEATKKTITAKAKAYEEEYQKVF